MWLATSFEETALWLCPRNQKYYCAIFFFCSLALNFCIIAFCNFERGGQRKFRRRCFLFVHLQPLWLTWWSRIFSKYMILLGFSITFCSKNWTFSRKVLIRGRRVLLLVIGNTLDKVWNIVFFFCFKLWRQRYFGSEFVAVEIATWDAWWDKSTPKLSVCDALDIFASICVSWSSFLAASCVACVATFSVNSHSSHFLKISLQAGNWYTGSEKPEYDFEATLETQLPFPSAMPFAKAQFLPETAQLLLHSRGEDSCRNVRWRQHFWRTRNGYRCYIRKHLRRFLPDHKRATLWVVWKRRWSEKTNVSQWVVATLYTRLANRKAAYLSIVLKRNSHYE